MNIRDDRMSLSIQYCFFCGLPITKSKGKEPDNMVEHHVSYNPEVKLKAHAYCHIYYHRMLYSHRKNDRYLLKAISQEKIKSRFLNRLSTGRGDGYIPYDQRTHHLPPFGDILLRRDMTKYTRKDQQRRNELDNTFKTNTLEMAKTLGLGPQSSQEDFNGIVKLVRRYNGILTTKHDLRYAGAIAIQTMREYQRKLVAGSGKNVSR